MVEAHSSHSRGNHHCYAKKGELIKELAGFDLFDCQQKGPAAICKKK